MKKNDNVDFTANLGNDAINTSVNYVYTDNNDLFGPGNNNYNRDYWTVDYDWTQWPYKQTQISQPFIDIDAVRKQQWNDLQMTVDNIKKPECYITTNKNRVKLFDSRSEFNLKQLFLKDNQEFEFELFNPTTTNYGVKIKLNGEYISNSHLILKAGQRIHLDRYLDSNNKFLFTTYTVENIKEVKDAIKNNGDISVEFYKEVIFNNRAGFEPGNLGYKTSTIFDNNDFKYGNDFTRNCFYSHVDNNIIGSSLDNNCTLDFLSFDDKTIETGQVGKGAKSDTEFTYVDMDFNMNYDKIFTFKILPVSQKPIETKDLVRHCTGCGKKAKKDWSFCSSCGTKI